MSVAIVTRVGDDGDGRATLENFKDNGLLTDFVSVETGRPTGVAPITVDTDTGDNSIIVVMGANDALTPQHISDPSERTALARCSICRYVSSPAPSR